MAYSADDVISLIDAELWRLASARNSVARVRRVGLVLLREELRNNGLPTDRDRRLELSLVPLVFQEANYDGIDWTDRAAPLEKLSGIFAVDLAVQSGGRERHELTDDEYREYVKASFAAIEARRKRP
jgi:hypothetical protein